MKKPVKTFQVASLFEGSQYVAVISSRTGEIISHITNGRLILRTIENEFDLTAPEPKIKEQLELF